MKKIIALILVSVTILSMMSISATALQSTTPEHVYNNDNDYVICNSRSVVTIADVDDLMGQLIEARLTDNSENEKRILEKFPEYGLHTTSLQEIQSTVAPGSQLPEVYSTSANIDFNTVYSETTVNGTEVSVMRVYATPKRGSQMYHEGVANSNTQPNLKAGSFNLLKTWAIFAVTRNKTVGHAVTAYNLLKDSISGFTTNSVVEQVDVDYVYRCMENVVFLYFLDETTNTWTLMGISTRLGTRVIEIVDTITIDNFAALPGGYTKEFLGDYYDIYYNNVSYCFSRWKYDGPCTRTQIENFSISGTAGENKAVASISMIKPYYPANCR